MHAPNKVKILAVDTDGTHTQMHTVVGRTPDGSGDHQLYTKIIKVRKVGTYIPSCLRIL